MQRGAALLRQVGPHWLSLDFSWPSGAHVVHTPPSNRLKELTSRSSPSSGPRRRYFNLLPHHLVGRLGYTMSAKIALPSRPSARAARKMLGAAACDPQSGRLVSRGRHTPSTTLAAATASSTQSEFRSPPVDRTLRRIRAQRPQALRQARDRIVAAVPRERRSNSLRRLANFDRGSHKFRIRIRRPICGATSRKAKRTAETEPPLLLCLGLGRARSSWRDFLRD
jgi:hypothetical protein